MWKKIKFISPKMDEFCRFWMPKRPIFTPFMRFSAFFLFSNFVRFGPFENCSRVIFWRSWRKSGLKYASHYHPNLNFKFDIFWPRDLGWLWLDTRSQKNYEGIYKYSRHDPCLFISLGLFHSDTALLPSEASNDRYSEI